MKKILSFVLVCALTLVFALSLVGCGKDKEEEAYKPVANPRDALVYLSAAGYDADYNSDVDYYEESGFTGLEGILEAEKGNELQGLEILFVFYFESEDALKSSSSLVDEYFSRLKLRANDMGFKVETGKSGKIAWVGTENAIKIAAGKSANSGNNNGGSANNGDVNNGITDGIGSSEDNSSVNLPFADPNTALGYFLDSGYRAELMTDDSDLEYIGIPGLVACLEAEKAGNVVDGMFIFYFESEEALEASRPKLNELLSLIFEDADEEGVELEVDNLGSIVWVGTENAIKVASGVKLNNGSTDSGGASGSVDSGAGASKSTPDEDPDQALALLEKRGYSAYLSVGADLGELADNYPGLIAVLDADIQREDNQIDAIVVYYFDSEESLKSCADEIISVLERQKEVAEDVSRSPIIVDVSGTMIWLATESALEDSN